MSREYTSLPAGVMPESLRRPTADEDRLARIGQFTRSVLRAAIESGLPVVLLLIDAGDPNCPRAVAIDPDRLLERLPWYPTIQLKEEAMCELRNYARQLASELELVPRNGIDRDVPEGARNIVMSDTFVKEIVAKLRGLSCPAELTPPEPVITGVRIP